VAEPLRRGLSLRILFSSLVLDALVKVGKTVSQCKREQNAPIVVVPVVTP